MPRVVEMEVGCAVSVILRHATRATPPTYTLYSLNGQLRELLPMKDCRAHFGISAPAPRRLSTIVEIWLVNNCPNNAIRSVHSSQLFS